MDKIVFTALLILFLPSLGSNEASSAIHCRLYRSVTFFDRFFPTGINSTSISFSGIRSNGISSRQVVTDKSTNEADFILGTWLSENADGKILITKINGRYFGRISWIKRRNANGSAVLDVKNPDPAKQKDKILGLEILKNFKYSGRKTWDDGFIYDPLSGKTYSCRISTVTNARIKIRGFIGIPLFGRSTFWTRTN